MTPYQQHPIARFLMEIMDPRNMLGGYLLIASFCYALLVDCYRYLSSRDRYWMPKTTAFRPYWSWSRATLHVSAELLALWFYAQLLAFADWLASSSTIHPPPHVTELPSSALPKWASFSPWSVLSSLFKRTPTPPTASPPPPPLPPSTRPCPHSHSHLSPSPPPSHNLQSTGSTPPTFSVPAARSAPYWSRLHRAVSITIQWGELIVEKREQMRQEAHTESVARFIPVRTSPKLGHGPFFSDRSCSLHPQYSTHFCSCTELNLANQMQAELFCAPHIQFDSTKTLVSLYWEGSGASGFLPKHFALEKGTSLILGRANRHTQRPAPDNGHFTADPISVNPKSPLDALGQPTEHMGLAEAQSLVVRHEDYVRMSSVHSVSVTLIYTALGIHPRHRRWRLYASCHAVTSRGQRSCQVGRVRAAPEWRYDCGYFFETSSSDVGSPRHFVRVLVAVQLQTFLATYVMHATRPSCAVSSSRVLRLTTTRLSATTGYGARFMGRQPGRLTTHLVNHCRTAPTVTILRLLGASTLRLSVHTTLNRRGTSRRTSQQPCRNHRRRLGV